ncbi:hypothetical protein CW749_00145 [Vibrio sp. vnigr-6D03]|uniref:DUF2971 domain-containing protein n=1 Tax=Vibrio sp. vnigr-6D03 TaxID=2058088 RepID=UPI000C34DE7D|nr:DUF2971 domain-containing protein [Vibrio sp. vnigr-6D03]PKF81095.1 hypothetical protein CW749_00145 [Vibrio sp. vnigr-6D03]
MYYKYRSFSEFSIKELLYQELYFATRQESNDPFDSKTFYEFSANENYWRNLLEIVAEKFTGFKESDINAAAKRLVSLSPMTYEQVANLDITKIIFESIDPKNYPVSILFSNEFKALIDLYAPEESYFTCFSKVKDDPLMWAHYAGNHQGFCLIFQPINGALNQHPFYRRTSVRRESPNGIAPSMGMGLPESFQFIPVEYQDKAESLCAFCRLPRGVTNFNLTEGERLKLATIQSSQYVQKHCSWKYEQEVRLSFTPISGYLYGQKVNLSKQERLFHYDPSQLVGIVLGAQMSAENKVRLREVITEVLSRRELYKQGKRVLFNFMVFEAELSSVQRNLNIKPVELLTLSKNYQPSAPEFDRFYSEWEQGVGIEFNGMSSVRVVISE